MTQTNKRGSKLAAAIRGTVPAEAEAIEPAAPAVLKLDERKKPVCIQLYVAPEDHKRIRDLSYHSGTSLQKLGIEAWNLLLAAKGYEELTPVTADKRTTQSKGA